MVDRSIAPRALLASHNWTRVALDQSVDHSMGTHGAHQSGVGVGSSRVGGGGGRFGFSPYGSYLLLNSNTFFQNHPISYHSTNLHRAYWQGEAYIALLKACTSADPALRAAHHGASRKKQEVQNGFLTVPPNRQRPCIVSGQGKTGTTLS